MFSKIFRNIFLGLVFLFFITAISINLISIFYFPNGVVLLRPTAGMGNQLFQYSAAYALAKSSGSDLYVIINSKSSNKSNILPSDRNHMLTKFNIPKDHIIFNNSMKAELIRSLAKLNFLINREFITVNLVNFMSLKGVKNDKSFLLINDYFESEVYFEDYKEEIRNIFNLDHLITPKLDNLLSKVQEDKSVCVHVRRGDFGDFGEKYLIPIEYQKKAMELMNILQPESKYYIFSDEISKAKSELSDIEGLTYISNRDLLPLDEFILMSKCNNNIIANSTFSWWAAYIGNNNKNYVIAPYPSVSDALSNTYIDQKHRYALKSSVYNANSPKDWIKIAFKHKPLYEKAKNIISDEKRSEILEGYTPLPFYIYSGDMTQLKLCDGDGTFKKGLCYLNDSSTNKPTIVTAYYQVKNKHGHDKYLEWAKKFLTIPFNLVVFTDKENSDWIKKARGDLPMVIIEKKFEDFYHNKFYDIYNDFYVNKDPLKSRSPELYILWAEKVKFVNEVIKLNPYKSEYFVWTDIGTFREDNYVDPNFADTKHMWRDHISYTLIEEFSLDEINNAIFTDKEVVSDLIRTASGLQVGDIYSWKVYNEVWDNTIQKLIELNTLTGCDQQITTNIALAHPELIRLLYVDLRFRGNPCWYPLLYYSENSNLFKTNFDQN
jgi:hypothetical protein